MKLTRQRAEQWASRYGRPDSNSEYSEIGEALRRLLAADEASGGKLLDPGKVERVSDAVVQERLRMIVSPSTMTAITRDLRDIREAVREYRAEIKRTVSGDSRVSKGMERIAADHLPGGE